MYRKRGAESAFGYGYGEHRCVAEWLARAELEIVFCKCASRECQWLETDGHCSYLVPNAPEPQTRSSIGRSEVLATGQGRGYHRAANYLVDLADVVL